MWWNSWSSLSTVASLQCWGTGGESKRCLWMGQRDDSVRLDARHSFPAFTVSQQWHVSLHKENSLYPSELSFTRESFPDFPNPQTKVCEQLIEIPCVMSHVCLQNAYCLSGDLRSSEVPCPGARFFLWEANVRCITSSLAKILNMCLNTYAQDAKSVSPKM